MPNFGSPQLTAQSAVQDETGSSVATEGVQMGHGTSTSQQGVDAVVRRHERWRGQLERLVLGVGVIVVGELPLRWLVCWRCRRRSSSSSSRWRWRRPSSAVSSAVAARSNASCHRCPLHDAPLRLRWARRPAPRATCSGRSWDGAAVVALGLVAVRGPPIRLSAVNPELWTVSASRVMPKIWVRSFPNTHTVFAPFPPKEYRHEN